MVFAKPEHKRIIRTIVLIVMILVLLLHGLRIVVVSYEEGTKVDPYHETEWVYDEQYEDIPFFYYKTGIRELITIENESDALALHEKLIRFLWGSQGFPTSKLPVHVEEGIVDTRYLHPYLERHAKRACWINQILNMTWGMNTLTYCEPPALLGREKHGFDRQRIVEIMANMAAKAS